MKGQHPFAVFAAVSLSNWVRINVVETMTERTTAVDLVSIAPRWGREQGLTVFV
jgi:hypothetical protein